MDDDFDFSDLEEDSTGFSDAEEDVSFKEKNETKPGTGAKHIQEMRNIFGLDNFKEKQTKRKLRKRQAKERKRQGKITQDGQRIVETAASSFQKSKSAPELVTFNDPRKRKKNNGAKRKSEENETNSQAVSMKEARFDVYKFGLQGLDKKDKANAEISRLISLGAKPAKNKCYDYPEFKEMRKKEKEEAKKAKELSEKFKKRATGSITKNKAKINSKANSKKPKVKRDSLHSKIGHFDGGMLRIDPKMFKK